MSEALLTFPIIDYPTLGFNRLGRHNPVSLGSLWHDNGRRAVVSTDGLLDRAVLVPGLHGWYQALYNSQASLLELLALLPLEPEPKFTALPEYAWGLVRERWPELHFNDHWLVRARADFSPVQTGEVVPLLPADLGFLCQHQPYLEEYGGRGYLAQRLEHGITAGIREEDGLRAWGILHEDGTLGFLRVRQELRRRGLAAAVVNFLVRRVLDAGLIPLGHISHYNRASLAIARGIGFEIAGKESWVRRRTAGEITQYKKGIF